MRTEPSVKDPRFWSGDLQAPVTALRRLFGRGRSGCWLQAHLGLRSRTTRTRGELWDVVERIERWDRPLRAARQGRKSLERLEHALAAHIASEEAGGHLEAVLEQAPRYQGQAGRLHDEHALLLRDMRGIRTIAQGADLSAAAWADVYQAFDGFAERLRIHDEAENEIVTAALLDDLGPGD